MSSSTPLQSFLGGLGLVLPVHSLLLLTGNVFGVSGFLHRAVRGGRQGIAAVAGLVSGGVLVGIVEAHGVKPFTLGFRQILLSGFLVGLGSKLSSGCTSGHMIAGVSRLSRRSVVATATFFTTGVIATRLSHHDLLPTINTDWTLGRHGKTLLALQAIPLAISTLLYFFPTFSQSSSSGGSPVASKPESPLRLIAIYSAGFEFALSLRLSNLSDPTRVLAFLLLPVHRSFDPSLAFLAAGAIPLSIVLYHFYRGPEKPRLGGPWAVPKDSEIDSKLIIGAALFGVGWGMTGICPGPGLVNVGRALSGGSGLTQTASWLGAVAAGGLLV